MNNKQRHIASVICFVGSSMLATLFIVTYYSICMWGSLYLLLMAIVYRIEIMRNEINDR